MHMKSSCGLQIRHVEKNDVTFWFSLDKHLSIDEFYKKVRDKQGYVLIAENKPVGILRYNLFWDNTPFCTLLYIEPKYQRQGFGKALMEYREHEMQSLGYHLLLVSTRSDEEAQHFYRKIGYNDCGNLVIENGATELFLVKTL